MRSKLNVELEVLKPQLMAIFSEFRRRSAPHWYPSVWVERRARQQLQVNPKSKDHKESVTFGVVWRLFDGRTLFEVAAQELRHEDMETLLHKVQSLSQSTPEEAYAAPSWADRLSVALDEEILVQIPDSPGPETWVHFGSALKRPMLDSSKDYMGSLEADLKKLEGVFQKPEFQHLSPDFLQVSLNLQEDHFLFVDAEVCLSQSLHRNLARLLAFKGEERSRVDFGGVGGAETIELQDSHFESCAVKLDQMLRAERLAPGRYNLLMGPSITGVFAHEAFGHTQEGDTWARGRSKAKELFERNERVGNEQATILNNPAIFKNGPDDFAAWGSYFFDEEGWLSQSQVLVDKGYLKPPMTHMLSHHFLRVPRTANAKRENWSHGVYTRQTNTYFSAGDKSLDEIIKAMDSGFIAEECAGGMEDPKGMGIQVGILYVEEVKDGRRTGRTFKGPNGGSLQMTGFVPDYLNKIEMKSSIEGDHPWNDVGGCAKYHKEVVNAGCGGPYMWVRDALLG